MNRFVVYGLVDAFGLIFYIGRTSKPGERFAAHARNLRKVGACGLTASSWRELESFDSLMESKVGERNWIEFGLASGFPLRNDGRGRMSTMIGFQVTPAMKRRVQKLLRAERQERPFVSFSDVLREVIDAGLRTQEAPGASEEGS